MLYSLSDSQAKWPSLRDLGAWGRASATSLSTLLHCFAPPSSPSDISQTTASSIPATANRFSYACTVL